MWTKQSVALLSVAWPALVLLHPFHFLELLHVARGRFKSWPSSRLCSDWRCWLCVSFVVELNSLSTPVLPRAKNRSTRSSSGWTTPRPVSTSGSVPLSTTLSLGWGDQCRRIPHDLDSYEWGHASDTGETRTHLRSGWCIHTCLHHPLHWMCCSTLTK